MLGWDKFVLFAKASRRIRDVVAREKPPYIFHVHDNGRITRVRKV